VARRSGLGRGLGALIPEDSEDELGASYQELPIDSIVPNPFQPREEFDEGGIASLADSIEQVGVLQPILVRPATDGGYQLIAGERRWRASQQAGLTTIPAIVKEIRDVSALEQAVIENLHRQDLNALEEAAAIQGLLIDGRLAAAHARALLPVEDRVDQQALAETAVAEGWSVRQVEQAVKDRANAPAPVKGPEDRPEPGTTRPAALLELEELLAAHLDTRVAVQTGAKRGKIVIDFADLDDLERLYRIIIAGD